MSGLADAIVIGGGVNGLVAAACLAWAGKRVVLLEARDKFGGICEAGAPGEKFLAMPAAQTLYALDPQIVKNLKLARYGLKFNVRDTALVGLRADGKHIVIQRDIHATAANIAFHSRQDAQAWPRFRRELFDLGRSLRPLWWQRDGTAGRARHSLDRIAHLSAAAWLDSWFESDALKATLCFDATAGGLSSLEAGSVLPLVWRAAQEMSGLQGAVAQAKGSTLVDSLVASAQGTGGELRTAARVVEVLTDGEAATGVRLESGETISASHVLSSLSRRRTLCDLIAPPAAGIAQSALLARSAARTAQAKVVLTFKDIPVLDGTAVPSSGRFILAERLETYAAADLAARAGQLADELPMEIIMPSASGMPLAPAGNHIISILVRPVPCRPMEGWDVLKSKLIARALQTFGRLAPDLAGKVLATEVLTSGDLEKRFYEEPHTGVAHMLATSQSRIETPIRGLLLCGADAEPVPAVSGRAARIAASMVSVGRK